MAGRVQTNNKIGQVKDNILQGSNDTYANTTQSVDDGRQNTSNLMNALTSWENRFKDKAQKQFNEAVQERQAQAAEDDVKGVEYNPDQAGTAYTKVRESLKSRRVVNELLNKINTEYEDESVKSLDRAGFSQFVDKKLEGVGGVLESITDPEVRARFSEELSSQRNNLLSLHNNEIIKREKEENLDMWTTEVLRHSSDSQFSSNSIEELFSLGSTLNIDRQEMLGFLHKQAIADATRNENPNMNLIQWFKDSKLINSPKYSNLNDAEELFNKNSNSGVKAAFLKDIGLEVADGIFDEEKITAGREAGYISPEQEASLALTAKNARERLEAKALKEEQKAEADALKEQEEAAKSLNARNGVLAPKAAMKQLNSELDAAVANGDQEQYTKDRAFYINEFGVLPDRESDQLKFVNLDNAEQLNAKVAFYQQLMDENPTVVAKSLTQQERAMYDEYNHQTQKLGRTPEEALKRLQQIQDPAYKESISNIPKDDRDKATNKIDSFVDDFFEDASKESRDELIAVYQDEYLSLRAEGMSHEATIENMKTSIQGRYIDLGGEVYPSNGLSFTTNDSPVVFDMVQDYMSNKAETDPDFKHYKTEGQYQMVPSNREGIAYMYTPEGRWILDKEGDLVTVDLNKLHKNRNTYIVEKNRQKSGRNITDY